jgi:hypothetical protein
LPHPSGLRAVALDASTVELQWDLPKDTSTILGQCAAKIHVMGGLHDVNNFHVTGVELSWNLMFGEQASLEWEVAGECRVYGVNCELVDMK